MMFNTKIIKFYESNDMYFIGIAIYSNRSVYIKGVRNFKGINISVGDKNNGNNYPHFFNFEVPGREVKEEISFRFSSTDISESKFFVTSIPELSKIFFHRPNNERMVTLVNTNEGTIDQITFDQFNRIRKSNKMVNNVILKNIKNRKKPKVQHRPNTILEI